MTKPASPQRRGDLDIALTGREEHLVAARVGRRHPVELGHPPGERRRRRHQRGVPRWTGVASGWVQPGTSAARSTPAPAPEVGAPAQDLARPDLLVQGEDGVQQRVRARRAAGRIDVDRDDLVDALDDRVVVEHAPRRGAHPHRDHPLRLGHLVVDLAQDAAPSSGRPALPRSSGRPGAARRGTPPCRTARCRTRRRRSPSSRSRSTPGRRSPATSSLRRDHRTKSSSLPVRRLWLSDSRPFQGSANGTYSALPPAEPTRRTADSVVRPGSPPIDRARRAGPQSRAPSATR